jgi:adenylate cyclase
MAAGYLRRPMARDIGKYRRRIRRTLRITLTWIGAGMVAAVLENNVLSANGLHMPLIDEVNAYFWRSLFGGLLGGGVYIFLLRDRLRVLPFLQAFGVMAALVLPTVLATHAALPAVANEAPFLPQFLDRAVSLTQLGQFLYYSLMMGATMLMVRLNDQYGSGGFGFLLGRYYKPRQELRIFMFLDMRSSTTIAEEIGHVRYFELLNDVYADITDPVIYSDGEVYQYVGDEVSVTWQLRKGIKDQRCVRCFFAIRRKLEQRAPHYRSRYGIVPQFKAGFHYGEVTTGEVGLVKKETIFSGDVVNTAARIQNSCNDHGVDNLVSKELVDLLRLPEHLYTTRHIGEIPLKGKRHEVSLWTIGLREAATAS